jgi:hypothetical protein
MLIRSQDKANLVPLGKVHILEGNGFFMIYDEPFYKGGTEIGRYEAESRCLEILDEIEDQFQYSNHFSGSGMSSYGCQDWHYGVYQMPEK